MVRDSLHRSGRWLDWYGYALLRSEWEARPAGWAPPRRPSLGDVAWPRWTDRLLIRRATAGDVPAVRAWSDDPQVSEWETAVQHDEPSFAARWADPARLPVRLVVEEEGAVVGELMLLVQDGEAQAEVEDVAAGCEGVLGWSFAAAVHGRGLATEAAADLVRVAFAELGLRRVTASCFADNVPSWRLMERLGMRREQHVVSGALHRTHGWVDGYGYALLVDEWRAAAGGSART
ncbi:GNAT family N-acetyltransferase [Iamia sp. SCSIO 61187]|nr:GNAT family N-acetyltransferase [Iamia sp. SCSIO 61187]